MKKFLLSALLSLPMVVGGNAFAARYTIDGTHTTVSFKVKHLAISSVVGSFGDVGGFFMYDPKDPKAWKAEATIQAKTIDTKQVKRDDHLKSPDFLDAEKFPAITFVSKAVSDVTDEGFKLKGELTIHGITKQVTLDVAKGGEAADPYGNKRAAFSASTKINRRDFGLTWSKVLEAGTLVVGDEVTISIDLEGVQEKA